VRRPSAAVRVISDGDVGRRCSRCRWVGFRNSMPARHRRL